MNATLANMRLDRHGVLVQAGVVLVAVLVAAYAGRASLTDPRIPMLIVAMSGALVLLALGANLSRITLLAIAVVLVGYALGDKGFAYLGLSPIYVSEVVLLLSIGTLLLGRKKRPVTGATSFLLLAYMAFGALIAMPSLSAYGINTIRDSVIWLYGAIALALSLILTRAHIEFTVSLFRRMVVPFLVVAPVLVILTRLQTIQLVWPRSNALIIDYKGGDYAVHLAGVAAFILVGLYATRARGHGRMWLVWLLWAPGFALAIFLGRSSMLTMGAGLAASLGLMWLLVTSSRSGHTGDQRSLPPWRPASAIMPLVVLLVLGSLAVALVAPSVELAGRSISVDQLQKNIASIVSSSVESSDPVLQRNRSYRLNWWNTIIDYTFHGQHFLTGKGFGQSLAFTDGFITPATATLRSPHSIHFTVLGRMGVPGLALWVALQLVWLFSMLRTFLIARRTDPFWAQVTAWVIVYWLAFMVNASFDVYLEGPQGGVWFWAIFGIGIALVRIQAETRRSGTGNPVANSDSSGQYARPSHL